jgi:hypothetical protein
MVRCRAPASLAASSALAAADASPTATDFIDAVFSPLFSFPTKRKTI